MLDHVYFEPKIRKEKVVKLLGLLVADLKIRENKKLVADALEEIIDVRKEYKDFP